MPKSTKRAFWIVALVAAIGLPWMAAKFIRPDHGGAKVFEGCDSATSPEFTVEQDWELEVDLKGDFRSVQLIPWDGDGETTYELLHPGKSANHIVQPWRTGGHFSVSIDGKGTWRILVRAASSN